MICLGVVTQTVAFWWCKEWLKQKTLLFLRLFVNGAMVLSMLTKLHSMKHFITFCECRRSWYRRESKRQTHLVQHFI